MKLGYTYRLKPGTHEPHERPHMRGRTPGFSDTQAALSGPAHAARMSLADTRRDREKHCIAMLFVAASRTVGSCVARLA